jgi:hypothetical protein
MKRPYFIWRVVAEQHLSIRDRKDSREGKSRPQKMPEHEAMKEHLLEGR